MTKKIYFIRHGETVGNQERYFQQFDTRLTEKGHVAAKAAAERLRQLTLDALVSSPMTRALETAEHVALATGLKAETFNDFHEHMQAESVRGVSHDDPHAMRYMEDRYYTHFVKDEPVEAGFENFNAVILRAKSCTKFLKGHSANNIAVVSHKTFIQTLSAFMMLQESDDKESNLTVARSLAGLSNAGISEFLYKNGRWELFTWNDHAHFAE